MTSIISNLDPQHTDPILPASSYSLIAMMENSQQQMATNNLALQALCQSFKAQNQSMRTHNQTLETQSQTLQTLNQSWETQSQRSQKLDQAKQNQLQLQEVHNKELTEGLVHLSTNLDRNNKLAVAIIEGLDEIHSNQQGTLWIMNGVARLMNHFRKKPELPGNSSTALSDHPSSLRIDDISNSSDREPKASGERRLRQLASVPPLDATPSSSIMGKVANYCTALLATAAIGLTICMYTGRQP
ncbi:MAG: hypothetical protein HW387_1273 [Parachlamydiales bacterium]|nr:hypothetical protein [Parachlamydiales bacterium]